jgi:DAK2 domain fusion protein YloV
MPADRLLDAAEVRELVTTYRDALTSHREAINRLNVYPVPDGDTGTNMSLTLESVVVELDAAQPDMAAVCRAISHGSLMGARGNSGVILSQVLRGLTAVLREHERVDAAVFASAMSAAAKAAYEAVMRPVEGTILTVVREAAEAAEDAAGRGRELVDVVEAARSAAADALERTPELLSVLRDAGVVDAGGAGFVLFLDALLHVLDGRGLPQPSTASAPAAVAVHIDAAHAEDGDDLRYEVMYLLDAPDDTIPAFKDVWAGVGDSIVVVGGEGIWNCHIHTDDIGAAIEAAIDAGRPRNIRVTDLHEQVAEERWVREAAARTGPEAPPHASVPVPTAVVAVGTGHGIGRIFYSLGVQQIVAGGQSMNPSTAQLLEAVEAAPAGEVIILPNNKNIIPVSEQVDGQTAKTVRVVPTKGISEGFAALLAYDPQADAERNLAAMTTAAGEVVSGEVTRAVRDATSEVGPVATGDFIGLARDGIKSVAATLGDAATGLLDALVGDDHELVTVIEGDGSTPAVTRQITEWLAENRPDVDAEIHHGGQPLYPYLFGVE